MWHARVADVPGSVTSRLELVDRQLARTMERMTGRPEATPVALAGLPVGRLVGPRVRLRVIEGGAAS